MHSMYIAFFCSEAAFPVDKSFRSSPMRMPVFCGKAAFPVDKSFRSSPTRVPFLRLFYLFVLKLFYIGENMREELLSIIEKNSRIDLKELAVMLGKEEIDVANEICRLEKDGVIGGYHTLINWEKTNIEKVTALIEVKVTPQRGQGFDRIAERIYNYPEVKSVYLISGGYDLLVTIEEKSLKEISNFVSDKLSTLDRVLSTATHFVLKKYKDHGTVLNKANDEEEREIITP